MESPDGCPVNWLTGAPCVFCSPPPVKAVFEGFDKLRTHEEILEQPGKVVLSQPPGRYAQPLRARK